MQLQNKINFEARLRKSTILAAHDSQRKRPGREMFQYNIDFRVSIRTISTTRKCQQAQSPESRSFASITAHGIDLASPTTSL